MVLEPLNLIARLVPLVPRPRTHQLRYHGLLAPRANLRASVIPERTLVAIPHQLSLLDDDCRPAGHTGGGADAGHVDTPTDAAPRPKLQRMAWARLLERMGGWDMETCPHCGAQLVVVGITLDPGDVARALSASGLMPVSQLDLSPARSPPRGQLTFAFLVGYTSASPRAA